MQGKVDSTYYKNKVRHRSKYPYLTMKISFRVDEETWSKLMDIAESLDVSVSYLLRIAIGPVLELEDDFLTYLPPLCPNCGAPLSAFFGTDKLFCQKCGKVYRLEEVERK